MTLRAVRFGYALLALECAIVAPWFTWDLVRGEIGVARFAFAMGLAAAIAIVFVVSFQWSKRRALAELSQVQEYRAAASEPRP